VGVTLGGSIGVGGAMTDAKGTQQSLLSQRLSPPVKDKVYGPSLFPLLLAAFLILASATQLRSRPLLAVACAVAGVGTIALYVWYHRRAQSESRTADAVWKSRIAVWDRLYYCYRDDCVFDPDQGEFVPVADAQKYIALKVMARDTSPLSAPPI
jgi:hypothetical protein